MVEPFIEEAKDDHIIRHFSKDVDPMLLKWHWDEEDRLVEPMNENDWQIQFDDELPQLFNKSFFIQEGAYHRLIKGKSDLSVKIVKHIQ
jgi:hypothetical protein